MLRVFTSMLVLASAAALWFDGMPLVAAVAASGAGWLAFKNRLFVWRAVDAGLMEIIAASTRARAYIGSIRQKAKAHAAQLRSALEARGSALAAQFLSAATSLVLALAALAGEIAPQAASLAPLFGDALDVPEWIGRLGLILSFMSSAAAVFWGHRAISLWNDLALVNARSARMATYASLIVAVAAFVGTLYIQVAAVGLRSEAINLRLSEATVPAVGGSQLDDVRQRVMLVVTLLAIATGLAGLRSIGTFARCCRCLLAFGVTWAYGLLASALFVGETCLRAAVALANAVLGTTASRDSSSPQAENVASTGASSNHANRGYARSGSSLPLR